MSIVASRLPPANLFYAIIPKFYDAGNGKNSCPAPVWFGPRIVEKEPGSGPATRSGHYTAAETRAHELTGDDLHALAVDGHGQNFGAGPDDCGFHTRTGIRLDQ
jgi:hypothetical protein